METRSPHEFSSYKRCRLKPASFMLLKRGLGWRSWKTPLEAVDTPEPNQEELTS